MNACRSAKAVPSPQAKPRCIGQVVDVGGAGRRGVYDARTGQAVLEFDAGHPLLRALGCTEATFAASLGAAGDAAHRVRLVEQDQPFEIGPAPFEKLLQPAPLAGGTAQRAVGYEPDGIALWHARFRFELRERANVERLSAER